MGQTCLSRRSYSPVEEACGDLARVVDEPREPPRHASSRSPAPLFLPFPSAARIQRLQGLRRGGDGWGRPGGRGLVNEKEDSKVEGEDAQGVGAEDEEVGADDHATNEMEMEMAKAVGGADDDREGADVEDFDVGKEARSELEPESVRVPGEYQPEGLRGINGDAEGEAMGNDKARCWPWQTLRGERSRASAVDERLTGMTWS
ncbi:hypothetical protein GW17_00059887 [Ensete ventricosum]|nr:hypothetical protein GW17_00059887 [Ensete ventricosum]